MGIAPETVVAPPATTPPLHSLLSSAVIIDEPAGSRWEGGFVFQPENCIESEAWNPCGECNALAFVLAICATSGTWEITWQAQTTGPLAFDITAAALEAPLNALMVAIYGGPDLVVAVTGGPGNGSGSTPYEISIDGPLVDAFCAGGPDPFLAFPNADSIDLAGGVCKSSIFGAITQAAGQYKTTKKSYDGNQDEVNYQPFIIEVPYTCSTFGFQSADYEKRARRQLEATMHKALENEFWTGSINPDNLSLIKTPNDDAHVLNPGGAIAPIAVNPAVALMMLAQALSNCGSGGRGMIHGTPAVVERWVSLATVQCTDKLITTCARGDIIVDGSGYPGTGPIGQPPPGPNEVWVYATGMVNIRVGEVEVYPKEFSEAIDRATNTVTYRGEIVASAVHDLCCSFAVLVDLCGTL